MTAATVRPARGLAFGTRVFLLCGSLIVFSVGAAVLTTAWRAGQIADATVRQALAASDSVLAALQRQQIGQLREAARLVAGDPAFGAYLAEGDPASVRDLLDERRAALRTDVLLATRVDGAPLAASGDVIGAAGAAFVRAALAGHGAGGALAAGHRVYVAAAAPVTAGGLSVEGALVAARELTAQAALDTKRASGADIAYVSLADGTASVAASTLADAADDLLPALRARAADWDAARRGDAPPVRTVRVGGENWIASVRPLRDAAGGVTALVVSLAAPGRVVAPFRRIEATLLLVGLLSVLVTFGVSFTLSRRLMRPVRELVAAAESAREGDFRHRISAERGDEIGRMARAFNALLADLRARREMEEFVAEISRSLPEPGDAWTPTEPQPRTTGASTVALGTPSGATIGPAAAPDTTLAIGEAPTADATAPASYRPLAPGADFARRYAIAGALGEGAMGVVYKARDRELGEMVALKMLRPGVWSEGEDVERLKQELRLARRVTHPHVLRTFDFGVEGDIAYITMEYVRGVSLRALLPGGTTVPVAAALRVARQIVAGVGAAHDAGIVHGDLKPENVLVELTGTAKIADFGIARPRRPSRGAPSLRAVFAGTPAYMAPEHLRAGAIPDAAGDIYACGVLFYELFTGQRAFSGMALDALAAEKRAGSPAPPRQFRPTLPDDLEALVLRCLAPDPADRPADMQSVARALDGVRLP